MKPSKPVIKKKPAVYDVNAGKKHFYSFSGGSTARRLILSVEGHQGAGKTHFALTAPDPIAFINLDKGEEGVIHKFGDKKISVVSIFPADTEEGAVKEMQKLREAYDYALLSADSNFRTVIVDTGSVLWELNRMAHFGQLKAMPTSYMGPNLVMATIGRIAAESSKNVIFLHRLKEEWKGNSPTGNYVFSGYKEMPYLVQAVLRMIRGDGGNEDFGFEITRCRHNTALIGRKFPKPVCNFDMAASVILNTA